MERIINGTLFVGKPADFVRLRSVETTTGHVELSAHRPIVWHEVCDVAKPQYLGTAAYVKAEQERALQQLLDDAAKAREESAAKHAQQAAQRAKTNVRHACKSLGATSLLTLTYRENQTDITVCKAHLKEFVRRVRRVWPSFAAVAGFEQQKRGAYHVHMAVGDVPQELLKHGQKVKSYNLIRAIWRDVTKELGGTINVAARKRHSKRSPARIAGYLSKYITKAFEEGEKWSNRWTKFGQIAKPKKTRLGEFASMAEAVEYCYGLLRDGEEIVTSFLSSFKDAFFIAFEPTRTRGAA